MKRHSDYLLWDPLRLTGNMNMFCLIRILNEMTTIQSILPANTSAQLYLSVLINVTHFILESGQGM